MMFIPLATQLKQLAFFIVVLAVLLIAMATYRSPGRFIDAGYNSQAPAVKRQRDYKSYGCRGGAMILALNAVLSTSSNGSYWPIFIVTAAIMLVGLIALVLTVNEPKLVKKMHEDSKALGIIDQAKDIDDLTPTKEKLPKDVKKSMALILASIALWFMGYNAITTAFSRYSVIQLGMSSQKRP